MVKHLALIVLTCFALGSCTVDPAPDAYNQREHIRSIHWMPGDSLLAALVDVPTDAYNPDPVFRLYDLQGNVQLETSLVADPYLYDIYVTKNGGRILYEANGSVFLLDISSKTSEVVFPQGMIICRAPDDDVFVLRRLGTMFSDATYMLAEIVDGKLIVDSVNTLPNDSFQSFFPLLLSEGRIATLELDSSNAMQFIIRDRAQDVKKRFFMPFGVQFMYPLVPANSVDFFFVQWSGMSLSAEILKFRTGIGVMDLIQPITTYGFGEYAVTSSGEKLIYKKSDANCFIKTIENGQENLLPGTERAEYISISHDDKTMAIVQSHNDANDNLLIIPLP